MVIPVRFVRNRAMTAVFHPVLEKVIFTAAVVIGVQRAKTKQAIDLLKLVTRIIFAIAVGKPLVTVCDHPASWIDIIHILIFALLRTTCRHLGL